MVRLLVPAVKFYFTENSDFPQIMTGDKHDTIYNRLIMLNVHIYNVEEGFLFKGVTFINRFEAATVARYEGIVSNDFTGPLTSEDLPW
jgi:hypothetical protein